MSNQASGQPPSGMAPDATYQYTAIEAPSTIRLMHIHPGSLTDPVHLSLETVALSCAPAFEAISYAWGDANDRRQVTCNGATHPITNNLFTGLRHFRNPHQTRILWADAVCINQSDPIEKSAQVLLMPDIYSQAARVLIWLGIANDPIYGSISSGVVEVLRHAQQLLPDLDFEDTVQISTKTQAFYDESKQLQEEGKPNVLDYDWLPLAALLRRPWFRRRWVIQEVSLAKEAVLCIGSGVEIQWLELAKFAYRFENLGLDQLLQWHWDKANKGLERTRSGKDQNRDTAEGEDTHPVTGQPPRESIVRPLSCITCILMVQQFRDKGTLLDGLRVTSEFLCTDPKDHIYSILSLVCNGPKISPDYGASLAEVLKRFAISNLLEDQSLKLLSLVVDDCYFSIFNKRRLEGLPSWVWDARVWGQDSLISYSVRPQAFFAGGHSKPILSLSVDERILSCQGRVIDVVETSAPSLVSMTVAEVPHLRELSLEFGDLKIDRRRKRFARWLEGCYYVAFGRDLSAEDIKLSAEELTSFSRAMVCGMDRMRNRVSPESLAKVPQYLQWALERAANGPAEEISFPPSHLITIHEAITSMSTPMQFSVTKNGHFARIPPSSRPGDCICVLAGGEVPFVIRQTGRGTYTLIGECYLDGMMDGEALKTVDGLDVSLEMIDLE